MKERQSPRTKLHKRFSHRVLRLQPLEDSAAWGAPTPPCLLALFSVRETLLSIRLPSIKNDRGCTDRRESPYRKPNSQKPLTILAYLHTPSDTCLRADNNFTPHRWPVDSPLKPSPDANTASISLTNHWAAAETLGNASLDYIAYPSTQLHRVDVSAPHRDRSNLNSSAEETAKLAIGCGERLSCSKASCISFLLIRLAQEAFRAEAATA